MPRTEHSEVLEMALQRIRVDKTVEAEILLNNFYYAKLQPIGLQDLLRELMVLESFRRVTDEQREALLKLLYHLDRKRPATGIRIVYSPAGNGQRMYHLKEE